MIQTAAPSEITKGARISDCGRYRYSLTRCWGGGMALGIIMLNPSTADAEVDDPTIRRCMAFAMREGFGGIIVRNLWAYRATDPADLKQADDPNGPDNNEHLERLLRASAVSSSSSPILCAWGAHGGWQQRSTQIIRLARELGAKLVCLGTTQFGEPLHPLYQPGDAPFIPFKGEPIR